MEKYRIKISYETGDSFGSNDETDYLDLEWTKLDVAKENLKRIDEHYKMYTKMRGWQPNENELDIVKKNKDKAWFVEAYPSGSIRFITDDGEDYQISCFWCGYFETLHGAEIKPDDRNMKIQF